MHDDEKKNKPYLIKESGWTVEDYYELPEDGNQYEIVDGRLELKPSPTTTHQRISQNLEHTMLDSCSNEYIIMDAPTDVILSDTETRQPDLLAIHRSRESIIQERAIVGPPDLVVEIISPNSAKRDRTMKRLSYARFGVPEYWIVDPFNLTVEQYVQQEYGQPYELLNVFGADDTVTSGKMPCIAFVVKDIIRI